MTLVSMQLRVFVYQAQNIQNRDIGGSLDCYFVARFCGERGITKISDKRIDPQWFEVLFLNVHVPWDIHTELNNAPRIHCQLFGDNFQKDTSLGMLSVAPTLVYCDQQKMITPKWHALENEQQEKIGGAVLLYFELILKKAIDKMHIPTTISPKMEIKYLHIITVGLRDVQTLLSVHKLFVEFEINGTIYKTERSNMPSARNPNFNQILHFPIALPKRRIFLPVLNLKIKDAIGGGAIQREIGVVSVDLRPYLMGEEQIQEQKDEKSYLVMSDREYEDDEKDDEKDEIYAKENIGLLSGAEKPEKPEKHKWNRFKSKTIIKDVNNSKSIYINKDVKQHEKHKQHKFVTYDIAKECTLKHPEKYMKNRDVLKDELDNKLMPKTFHDIDFFNVGQKKRVVGYFRGLISVTDSKKNDGWRNKYLTEITKSTELFLRLYIKNGIKLRPPEPETISAIKDKGDIGSLDPYLIIKLGNEKRTTRDKYISNSLNPEFRESFEFSLTLPGVSNLQIEVWGYYGGDESHDEVIGVTNIDIEDRW
eukprot:450458_1